MYYGDLFDDLYKNAKPTRKPRKYRSIDDESEDSSTVVPFEKPQFKGRLLQANSSIG